MDIEERKLLPNVLDLMEGVTPHFSQLAVGQKGMCALAHKEMMVFLRSKPFASFNVRFLKYILYM